MVLFKDFCCFLYDKLLLRATGWTWSPSLSEVSPEDLASHCFRPMLIPEQQRHVPDVCGVHTEKLFHVQMIHIQEAIVQSNGDSVFCEEFRVLHILTLEMET